MQAIHPPRLSSILPMEQVETATSTPQTVASALQRSHAKLRLLVSRFTPPSSLAIPTSLACAAVERRLLDWGLLPDFNIPGGLSGHTHCAHHSFGRFYFLTICVLRHFRLPEATSIAQHGVHPLEARGLCEQWRRSRFVHLYQLRWTSQ